MYCKNCGKETKENSFCLACGYHLGNGKSFCQHCGDKIVDGADLCLKCGKVTFPLTKRKKHYIRCPQCQGDVATTADYCIFCGTSMNNLKNKCPQCHEPFKPDQDVCLHCGFFINADLPAVKPVKAAIDMPIMRPKREAKPYEIIGGDKVIASPGHFRKMGFIFSLVGICLLAIMIGLRVLDSIFAYSFVKLGDSYEDLLSINAGVKNVLDIINNIGLFVLFALAIDSLIVGSLFYSLSSQYRNKILTLLKFSILPTFAGIIFSLSIFAVLLPTSGVLITTFVFFCLYMVLLLVDHLIRFIISPKSKQKITHFVLYIVTFVLSFVFITMVFANNYSNFTNFSYWGAKYHYGLLGLTNAYLVELTTGEIIRNIVFYCLLIIPMFLYFVTISFAKTKNVEIAE